MTHLSRRAILLAATCLVLGVGASAFVRSGPQQKGTAMTTLAKGTFDVTITPQADAGVGDPTVGRMSIDKRYHGDLEGSGLGQMLAGMTDVKDSAAYVAIERFRGTLAGRTGTFALQHSGTMTRGAQALIITVIPDSGTEQLVGIAGTLTIDIRDGKHFYTFDYTLP